jgi:polyphosphate glucokinase
MPKVRTLTIDIGGTGLKAMIIDDHGVPVVERVRVETPRPATPDWTVVERSACKGFRGEARKVDGTPVMRISGRLQSGWNYAPI